MPRGKPLALEPNGGCMVDVTERKGQGRGQGKVRGEVRGAVPATMSVEVERS